MKNWRGDNNYSDGLITYLLTYLLTPWCRVLLQQLTGLQLVKKFHTFHRTRKFITALTSVHHLSLSWASPIQSIYPHPTSWRSVLILFTLLSLGLPSGLLPSGFPTKTLQWFYQVYDLLQLQSSTIVDIIFLVRSSEYQSVMRVVYFGLY